MAVRFAAARSTARSPIARALAWRAIRHVANDNGAQAGALLLCDDAMREALRQFARHGLGTARIAARNAEAAHGEGDHAAYRWWLGICTTLDRGVAEHLKRRVANPIGLAAAT